MWEGSKGGESANYWKDFLSGESKIKGVPERPRASIENHYPIPHFV